MATCALNGSWSPDPGILACNGKLSGCDLTDSHLVWKSWFVYMGGMGLQAYPVGYKCSLWEDTPFNVRELGCKKCWKPYQMVQGVPYNTNSFICLLCSPVSAINCSDPTPASGVIVRPYNTTAVGSIIYYHCQKQGLVLSSSCDEDGMWSPDPSQLICEIEPTVMIGRPVEYCLLRRTM